jgi:mono/diheme cytochrome c family protein
MRIVLSIWLIVAGSVLADDREAVFRESIEPLLKAKCISCHGPEKQEGGLRLDSRERALHGGENGPAFVEGKPGESLLIRAVKFDDPDLQMPPKDRLSDAQVAALTQWIEQGATWPATDNTPAIDPNQVAGDAFTDPENPIRKLFRGERLDLWSLKPPVRTDGSASVDSLVEAALSAKGLTLSPEADRRTLIRRVTFDLTGLPPTPEAVDAFIADRSPNAYENLVARLLASSRYGERQARLWLDVVRYADTHGYERDEFRPLAWKYRDYVVRAFNQDKPFDRFVLEQLAGDELVASPPATPEEADALIATGYLQLGQWDSTASIFQESDRLRADEQADLTNTTAAAFLGLTMSCCQCHDHKYDPLSQADHYRLRAFFAGVQRRDDLVIELPPGRDEIAAHNAALDAEMAPLKEEQSKLDEKKESDKPRLEELKKQLSEIGARQRHPEVTMGASDRTDPPATQIFYQGDFSSPREEVAPGFVSVIRPGPASVEAPREGTTGRRLALAKWIVSRDNPWTARVLVNRIWQQHFGTGLVATPNDFGYTGARPTHPELLDWLAIEFMENSWSVKELHRRIVLSRTYRQASVNRAEAQSVDPDNQLLWRQNVQRLDAEMLRDALLSVSGQLKLEGSGPARWPEVPQELLYAQPAIQEAIKGEDGGRMQGWFTSPVEETDVRSLYLVRKRCLPIPFLQAFDLPGTETSCARRDRTVVAPQALMLLNSPESVRSTEAFAERVLASVGESPTLEKNRETIIRQAFRLALMREPDSAELELTHQFLSVPEAGELKSAVVSLCRAVLNLNEFVYYD